MTCVNVDECLVAVGRGFRPTQGLFGTCRGKQGVRVLPDRRGVQLLEPRHRLTGLGIAPEPPGGFEPDQPELHPRPVRNCGGIDPPGPGQGGCRFTDIQRVGGRVRQQPGVARRVRPLKQVGQREVGCQFLARCNLAHRKAPQYRGRTGVARVVGGGSLHQLQRLVGSCLILVAQDDCQRDNRLARELLSRLTARGVA